MSRTSARGGHPPASGSAVGAALCRLLPRRLRHRAISVSVLTPRSTNRMGEPVPFTVTLANRLPVPVTLRTAPTPWRWTVDGLAEAGRAAGRDRPEWAGQIAFHGGETKRFERRWSQRLRRDRGHWVQARPGDHTIGAAITVPGTRARPLADETTVAVTKNGSVVDSGR